MLYGLSLIVGLVTFLFILNFNLANIPTISDLMPPRKIIANHRLELDSVRGIAALLVVLEHTWWPFAGAGATGVWLFFALSGYLLTQPFISKPERALDGSVCHKVPFSTVSKDHSNVFGNAIANLWCN